MINFMHRLHYSHFKDPGTNSLIIFNHNGKKEANNTKYSKWFFTIMIKYYITPLCYSKKDCQNNNPYS